MDGPPPLWAVALVADPYSPEIVSSRLKDLLDKEVEGVFWLVKGAKRTTVLDDIVRSVDWSFKPEAFDAIWHAVFNVAKKLGCTEDIRDATYWWTEQYLQNEALDAIPEDGDEDYGLTDGLDKTWIATAIGAARLYALGYGYSPFAWNSLLDGLALPEPGFPNSDSMRIGSCGQLLGAGQRLKLRIHGGGDRYATPGFAGRYMQAQPPKTELEKKEGEEFWERVLKALEDQQALAGAKAAALLQRTLEHLKADAPDMTSIEVANIIWPKST